MGLHEHSYFRLKKIAMSTNVRAKESMLEGSLWNKILGFAFPLAFTGILQQLFNAADVAVVGNFAGDAAENAMAAVGANTPIIAFIVNGFLGISLGTNVVVANAIGRKDDDSVKKAVHTSIIVSLIGGIVIALLGEIFAEKIMSTQNIDPEALHYAVLYFRIYVGGLPVILLYNFAAAVFRGSGNTRLPFLALMFSGVINVMMNIFFVVVLHRTVDGVAAATVISNFVSGMILMIALKNNKTSIRFEFKELRIDWPVLLKILRIGIPASIQSCVFSAANILIQTAINGLGKTIAAASAAAFNLEIFSYYVLNSFSQACTTFTGQNFGAKKFDRCKKTLRLCLLEGIVVEIIMVTFLQLFGRQILMLFKADSPELVEIGYVRIMFITTAHLFSLFYEGISGYLRGYGISLSPALLTMFSICGIRITWLVTVFEQYHTFESLMLVYPVSLGTTAVLMVIMLLIWSPAKRFSRVRGKIQTAHKLQS